MKKTLTYLGIAGLLAAGTMVAFAETANAQYYGNQGRRSFQGSNHYGTTYGSSYNPSYGLQRRNYNSGPVYHAPSVHYDRVYQPTRLHWTPRRGLHTHGYNVVRPHYTPGHLDTRHGNHVDPNPYYHHR